MASPTNELTEVYVDEPFIRLPKSLLPRLKKIGLGAAKALVAMYLMDLPRWKSEEPVVWASSEVIAADTGVNESQVRRILREMESRGLLVVVSTARNGRAQRLDYSGLCQAVFDAGDSVTVRRFDGDGKLCETPPRRAAEPAPEQAPAAISEFVEEPVPAPTPNPAPAKTWPCGYCGNEYGRELQAIKCAARCSVDRVAILGEINAKADAKEMPAAPETPKAPEPVLAAPTACATCRAYGSTWVPSQQAPCTIHSGPAPAEWVAAHRDRERTRLRERGVPPKLWPSELQAAA